MRPPEPWVASLEKVSLQYGKVCALQGIDLKIPSNQMVGLIGPDGVGKSSLLALLAGARKIQAGNVHVLGGDMRQSFHRQQVCPQIAYMPQGLGRNLYATLSVYENVDFFGRLFGHSAHERKLRIADLLESTGLAPFANRPASKLSGGMKQKLGLCCALIHDPELLILDEPTTGVDPLSRAQFWDLIDRIRSHQKGMSVIVATAYMEEAERFDWLVAMDAGKVLATGSPPSIRTQTQQASLEAAFVALLPEEKRGSHQVIDLQPARLVAEPTEIAIEAQGLTCRFGDFVAVDHVSFRIPRGEIFGFLGSNGCGKSTTMKMLTGLLPASEGTCTLFGEPVDATDLETRRRVGYMSQSFSLYGELTVRQNLSLHAQLFQLPAATIAKRVSEMLERFDLRAVEHARSGNLPLGIRQRLSLAVAVIHRPELLILDEPTSGVDPIARDRFWQLMLDLSRQDGVTIFISTHFMNEAERCDRISLMHAGKVLASDTPSNLIKQRGARNLEETFIAYLQEASENPTEKLEPKQNHTPPHNSKSSNKTQQNTFFSPQRLLSYSRREAMELSRDPVRLTLALVGTMILMFIMGYGISMDVNELTYAVLDRDQTTTSESYTTNIAGSRYFVERPPLKDYEELDRRMRSGEISMAIEIPPGFGRDVKRGASPAVGMWIDGSMPTRAETILGYAQGMHYDYLRELNRKAKTPLSEGLAKVEIRFRYNPDVESIKAMVPAVIPLLLMMIPAMLTALGVVREKELGSICNFYVTPTTRLEFLLGKQLPYVALGLANFLLLSLLAQTIFQVPVKGSYLTLVVAAAIYVACSTGLGLLTSVFMRSQIAAVLGVSILTMLPAIQFSGLIHPVSSLEGWAAWIGRLYPTSHFLIISRGVFSKALGLQDLWGSLGPLIIMAPVLLLLSVLFLRKQEA